MTKRGRGLFYRVRGKFRSVSDRLSRLLLNDSQLRRRTFSNIYKRGEWGASEDKYFSGVGSSETAGKFYAEHMAELLQEYARQKGRPLTIVDFGCGDFRVGRALLEKLPNFRYIGCDIVAELIAHNNAVHSSDRITFRALDIVHDPLPDGDVCLIRQVFQHLSNGDILRIIGRMPYPLVYVSESQPVSIEGPANPDKPVNSDVRFNWRTGHGRGVELRMPPFNLTTVQVFSFQPSRVEIIVTEQIIY